MHNCPECGKETTGAVSEDEKRLIICPDCYERIATLPDWELKDEKEKKVMGMGIYIFCLLQNKFFVEVPENELANVFEDNIKKFVDNTSYQEFINRHKKIKELILKREPLAQKIAVFLNELIPNEPKIYPIRVYEAQEKHPEILLDIVSLELQYFLSLNVAYIIKNSGVTYEYVGDKFFDHYIYKVLDLAGWSTGGIMAAQNHGGKRCDEYLDAILNKNPKLLGMLAGLNILNTNEPIVGNYLTGFFFDYTDYFSDRFEDMLINQHGDQGF